jgi:hypothetical protein
MRNLPLLALPLALVAGCASVSRTERLTTQPTPSQWARPSNLRFAVFDSRHQSLGSFVIELTDEPASTGIAGTWFMARPVSSELKVVGIDLTTWWKDPNLYPSYSIDGRFMMVELNGGAICDDYIEVNAHVGKRVARGVLQVPAMFGGRAYHYGRVLVEKLP